MGAARDLGDQLDQATAAIRERTSVCPRLAVVLGSGLQALSAELREGVEIPYEEIPCFPTPVDSGHMGSLAVGRLGRTDVVLLGGRAHLYEGYTPAQVVFPVRLLRRLGVETVVVTNAAGGVNRSLTPGTLMLIRDHINLTGRNPLCGPNDAHSGPRFPDMTEAYDGRLRMRAREVARTLGVPLPEGVYLGLTGPSFETPAEIRMAAALGADAVGMSTVLEVIAARHCGLRVLGISCITNAAAGLRDERLSAQEVVAAAARSLPDLSALLVDLCSGQDLS